MKLWQIFIFAFVVAMLNSFIHSYFEAYHYNTPDKSCVMSMERKAIQDPAYFKEFWERVAQKLQEENQ